MSGNEPARKDSRKDAEERLLIEAAQRDPTRFADLYENNFEFLYAYIVRRVRDRDTAEDLTSEVFKKALESLPRFKWRGAPFAAWLITIAKNMIADRSKRASRESGVAIVDDLTETNQINLEEVEQSAMIFRLVIQLPEDQRKVIGLRFGEEKSIRDIALEMGRSEGAIKQLQFRGLQTLRASIGESNG
jgi:RNA polymerase sigma-70 factor (ECF subfamily)